MTTEHEKPSSPRVYHIRIDTEPPSAEEQAWLDDTSKLTERFIAPLAELSDIQLAMASMVIHCTAEFLFEHRGAESAFDQLDPAAFIARVVRTSPSDVGYFAGVLRDFYTFLVGAGVVERARGQFLACYFDTLLELHGAGPTGLLPTRASRRATATLARRITEARLRAEDRARKKSAA